MSIEHGIENHSKTRSKLSSQGWTGNPIGSKRSQAYAKESETAVPTVKTSHRNTNYTTIPWGVKVITCRKSSAPWALPEHDAHFHCEILFTQSRHCVDMETIGKQD